MDEDFGVSAMMENELSKSTGRRSVSCYWSLSRLLTCLDWTEYFACVGSLRVLVWQKGVQCFRQLNRLQLHAVYLLSKASLLLTFCLLMLLSSAALLSSDLRH